MTIGIGHSAQKLENISRSFQSALDALGYRSVVGTGSTIYINDVEPGIGGKLQFGSEEESALIQAIKFGPEEKIRETVRGIVDRMNEARVHARQQQAYILSVANCMIQLIQQYDLNMEEIFAEDPLGPDPFTVIQSMLNRENFSRWLFQTALKINSALSRERDYAARQVIEKAKQYIMDNYQDPGLSVEQICRYLHMSPAYFSTMFKKATGQTYIAYLTEVRLNKAVELLNMTDEKTYVIASQVGYQEQNYFSYVFKKRFGVSPTKFRGSR